MSKIRVELELDDKLILGQVKAQIRADFIKQYGDRIFKKVKGREVVIEGLIESAIRQEVKAFISNSEDVRVEVKKAINKLSARDLMGAINEKQLSDKLDKAIESKLSVLLKAK